MTTAIIKTETSFDASLAARREHGCCK